MTGGTRIVICTRWDVGEFVVGQDVSWIVNRCRFGGDGGPTPRLVADRNIAGGGPYIGPRWERACRGGIPGRGGSCVPPRTTADEFCGTLQYMSFGRSRSVWSPGGDRISVGGMKPTLHGGGSPNPSLKSTLTPSSAGSCSAALISTAVTAGRTTRVCSMDLW